VAVRSTSSVWSAMFWPPWEAMSQVCCWPVAVKETEGEEDLLKWGGAPLVSVKAEWVGTCEGERGVVAEGLWRLRRRWVAGSVGLEGTSLLGGGAERKDRGKRGR